MFPAKVLGPLIPGSHPIALQLPPITKKASPVSETQMAEWQTSARTASTTSVFLTHVSHFLNVPANQLSHQRTKVACAP